MTLDAATAARLAKARDGIYARLRGLAFVNPEAIRLRAELEKLGRLEAAACAGGGGDELRKSGVGGEQHFHFGKATLPRERAAEERGPVEMLKDFFRTPALIRDGRTLPLHEAMQQAARAGR